MKWLLMTIILCSTLPVFTQQNKLPCSRAEFRQFDFWIGEWEVYNTKGAKAGHSKVSLLLDSCVLLEEWSSEAIVQGLRYAGKSYNSYNPAQKRWQQYWVDNTGNSTSYFNGHYEEKKMILITENLPLNDTAWQMQKMTFHHLSDDKVRQHGETSADGGKTWITSFDLEYRRKKSS